jgi:hypothetical protein
LCCIGTKRWNWNRQRLQQQQQQQQQQQASLVQLCLPEHGVKRRQSQYLLQQRCQCQAQQIVCQQSPH